MELVLDFKEADKASAGLLAAFQEALGHELPNRLVAIQGLARLLEVDVAGIGAEHRLLLARIAEGAERAHRLVRTLAQVGHLCREACSHLPTDVIEASREAGAAWSALSSGARLEYDLPKVLPPVAASRPALTRAILELLRNAALAAPSAAFPVELGGRATPSAVEVWVADHGRGLPEVPPERLFAPFQHSVSPAGLGLGLFIVRQLVACWHGAIHVRSTPETGARFALLVPRLAEGMREEG
jgi:signal transduction histidine kinase